jgi:GMP synthase-like glutamine amidotransferase
MKTLAVIQHTSAEYLGLVEDHLEGRGTRFQYFRPFTSDGKLPDPKALGDGLILLGAGPWGSAGVNDVPSLQAEVEITKQALAQQVPVVGFGFGAHVLAIASGAQVSDAPLRMTVDFATRTDTSALASLIPERFPVATYLRDRLTLPADARVLATFGDDDPAIWQIGENNFGFVGHPGLKPGMVEDLIMEFDDAPDGVGERLPELAAVKTEIADALVPLMTGLVRECHWM